MTEGTRGELSRVPPGPVPGPVAGPDGVVPDFTTASRAVLRFLRDRIGFDLFCVTRVEGSTYTILTAEDHGTGTREGDVLVWSDTLCHRMVEQAGPVVLPRVADVEEFARSPFAVASGMQAYVGAPIRGRDGALFGTLCGVDPRQADAAVVREGPLLGLLAELLGGILTAERHRDESDRRAERAELDARVDALTGLGNRRGWDLIASREEARARRYGDPVGVVSVDLDGLKEVNDRLGHAAGDDAIRRAADVVQEVVRETDYAARLGGDEFAVLAVSCGADGLRRLADRLTAALDAAGVPACTGAAMRESRRGVDGALADADAAMYRAKRARRAAVAALTPSAA